MAKETRESRLQPNGSVADRVPLPLPNRSSRSSSTSTPRPTPRGASRDPSDAALPRPSELAAFLLEGDPLELEARCRARLRETAIFLCPRRLFLRVLAEVGVGASDRAGGPGGPAWIRRRIDRALERLVELQAEEEFRRLPLAQAPDALYLRWLACRVGVLPGQARLACLALNRLPEPVRRGFWREELEPASTPPADPIDHARWRTARKELRRALARAAEGESPRARNVTSNGRALQ